MGETISRPLMGETPRDFMNRNNKAFFTEPYISNLAGWSEGKIQLDPFPRDGSFKDEDMCAAKDMIFGSWGDPGWPIDYMKDAYKVWMKMKTYWDKGSELKKQDSSLSQSQLKPDASLPPYECVVSAEIPKPLTNRLYPQLPSTTEVFPFVQLPDGYKITPLSVTEAVAICKDLPDPAKSPHQFVAVLQRLTAYSQLTGRDYRFILTKTLPAEITEEEMIEEVYYLNPIYDTPPVRRVVSQKAGDSKPLDLSKPSRVLLITDSEEDEDEAGDWIWASSEKPTHPFVPGQQVLIKCLKPTKLGEPKYLGPATVIAVTRTGVLTDFQPQWIHASRLKAAPSQGNVLVNEEKEASEPRKDPKEGEPRRSTRRRRKRLLEI
ncbi:uncharacterized protein LOC125270756 isoform X2 [Megalobrama amblycephala]|uniref:uncharacterized protein LOC125270756 isoform X2 n=1 Tax=Megalobrama amblycephala TaxID=75352 RepID=UPI0020146344|nr:uncharacterized protein LOC125270756 isoform X2 [Megalobrama amblycephala]